MTQDTERCYRVRWEIDIYAVSHHNAAEQALFTVGLLDTSDPDSATVFDVIDEDGCIEHIDLSEQGA